MTLADRTEISMRIVMLTVAACVAAAAFGPAVAAPHDKKDAGDKVICRTMEEIGSRLSSKRVCLTRSQWRDQQATQRQNLEKAQRIRTGPDIG
jgi:hypothetical protein